MKTLFFIAGFWLVLSNFFALSQSAAYTDSEHAFNSHERNRHKHKILQQQQTANDQPMLLHTYQKVNCSSCSVTDKELFTKFYKDELKKSILKFLKMERAPNVSVEDLPSHLVNHFKKLYDEDDLQAATTANNAGSMMMSDQASEEDEEDSKSFKTNLVHVFSKNPSDSLPSKITNGRNVQFFNLDMPLLKKKEILNATMYVHLPRAPKHGDANVWIDTHVLSINTLGDAVSKRNGTTHAELDPNYGGWVQINVTQLVRHWIEHRNKNFGVELKVKTSGDNSIEIPTPTNSLETRGNTNSYIVLVVKDTSIERTARSTHKMCNDDVEGCCMSPLDVDFQRDYDWKFIIHPTSFHPNFCEGDCSLGKMAPENTYAHILQQSGYKPCCSPEKMRSLKMLYMDEEQRVFQGVLPKMIVERCKCG